MMKVFKEALACSHGHAKALERAGPNFLRALALFLILPIAVANAQDEVEKARMLAESGETAEALALLEDVIVDKESRATTVIEARYMRGIILLGDGQTAEAKSAFAELLREYPELPEPYNNLAAIYAAEGEFEKARDLLSRVLEKHPDYAVALENLGDLYAKMAIDAYERAREQNPEEFLTEKIEVIGQLFEPRSE